MTDYSAEASCPTGGSVAASGAVVRGGSFASGTGSRMTGGANVNWAGGGWFQGISDVHQTGTFVQRAPQMRRSGQTIPWNVPLMDPNTGIISPVWGKWLLDLTRATPNYGNINSSNE